MAALKAPVPAEWQALNGPEGDVRMCLRLSAYTQIKL